MVMTSPVPEATEKLVNSVESSHPGIIQPVKSFVLKSNESFASKASGVFNRLSSLENEHSVWMTNNETHESFEAGDVSGHASGYTSITDGASANGSGDISEIASIPGNTSKIGSTSANDSGDISITDSVADQDSCDTCKIDNVTVDDSDDTIKSDDVNVDDSGDTTKIDDVNVDDSGDTSKIDVNVDDSGDTTKIDNVNVDDSSDTTKIDDVNVDDSGDTTKIDSVNVDDSGDTTKIDNTNADDTSKTDHFKMPYLPVRKIEKRAPIRKKKNTRIWRKYSLKNVPLTSDSKNAAVAYEFLDEIKKKKEGGTTNETAAADGKITYRKPVKRSLAQSTITSSSEASSSSTTTTDERPNKITCSIRLDHLSGRYDH